MITTRAATVWGSPPNENIWSPAFSAGVSDCRGTVRSERFLVGTAYNASAPNGVALADFNGDSKLDGNDLSEHLASRSS